MDRTAPATLKCTLMALAVIALMPACASAKKKAQCPVPDGVKCMGLADVYQRTENADHVSPVVEEKATRSRVDVRPAPAPAVTVQATPVTVTQPVGPRRPVAYQPVKYADAVQSGETLSVVVNAPNVQVQTASAPVAQQYAPPAAEPVRAEAKVMRILVSAWEDESGSLHMPGTIFTEIEPRRWNVGSPSRQDTGGYRLLEGLGDKAAKESQAPASSANAVANRPGS